MTKINSLLSGEFILNSGNRPNGGGIVVSRSIWVTSWLMLSVLLIWNLLRPCDDCTFQSKTLSLDLIALGPWTGAVFGGVYLAFYSRFSSQWMYLANLYNQIKVAEMNLQKDLMVLAQWKAGFIEDAIDLHLATKPNIAGIIRNWSQNNDIQNEFIKNTPGGKEKWKFITNLPHAT